MLSDYFPPKLRATVLAIYSSGIYIGAGIGIFLGGWIVEAWQGMYPDPADAPFGLKGWQAAYMAVGLPGLLMALWVFTLREPVRGGSEGIVTEEHPRPFREAWRELMAVLPPFTVVTLVRSGAGAAGVRYNLTGGFVIALGAWGLLYLLTGDPEQWIALGIGTYAAFSWVQALGLRDPATFAMMFQSRAFVYAIIGFPTISLVSYAYAAWAPPFFLRVHGVGLGEAGLVLGVSAAVAGWLGITLGGIVSDWLKPRTGNGRVYVGLGSITLTIPLTLVMIADRQRGRGVCLQLPREHLCVVLDRRGGEYRERPGHAAHARHRLGVLHPHGDGRPGPRPVCGGGGERRSGRRRHGRRGVAAHGPRHVHRAACDSGRLPHVAPAAPGAG